MISIVVTIQQHEHGLNVTYKGEGKNPTDAEQVMADEICTEIPKIAERFTHSGEMIAENQRN